MLNHVLVQYYDTTTSTWQQNTEEVVDISIDRGGSTITGGFNTVEVGTMTVTYRTTLGTGQAICDIGQAVRIISLDADDIDLANVFTAKVQDIVITHEFNETTRELEEFVEILCVDYVQILSNIQLSGSFADPATAPPIGWLTGSETWQDRIANLQTAAYGKGYPLFSINSPGDLPYQNVYTI
jgi:hypothetical protein